MLLYLLRHAIAVSSGHPAYTDDTQRPLTPAGAVKMKRIARGLQNLKAEFDQILSSPYVRACQTAEILSRVYDTSQVTLTHALTPDAPPDQIIAEINDRYRLCQSLMLVGHEPQLRKLISVLLTGTLALQITLKKGGVCRLNTAQLRCDQCAKLDWLLYPAQLIRLAQA